MLLAGSEADDQMSMRNNARKPKDRARSPAIKRVLPSDAIKQRVPDTEHLARMRALLVQAHTNDSFIKKLASGNSYVPKNGDPEGSKEMGQSFGQVFKKNSLKLQRKLEKADREAEGKQNDAEHLEALIRGDNMNQQAQMMDSDSDDAVDEEDSVMQDSQADDNDKNE